MTTLNKKHYRSIFISDTHLGYKLNRSDLLNDFLKNHSCDKLYLVGDIVDIWALERRIYWSYSDSLAVRQILNKKRHNSEVFYITGNHDGHIRELLPDLNIEGVSFHNELVHIGVDGKKYLVVHGDIFDNSTPVWEIVSRIGDRAYTLSLHVSSLYTRIREFFNLAPWSLSLYLKQNVKEAVKYINQFEDHMVEYCKDYDGIICGHIHNAVIKNVENLTYMNCGDWVESFTALVENEDGSFEIIRWDTIKTISDPTEGTYII
jgi:UDP-2,3-diacylglucosamine pyrophosphatase LpxH